MSELQPNPIQQIEHVNPLAFVLYRGIVNENGSLLEFHDHRFMIDPYADYTPEQVQLKCSQIGGSTGHIIKAIHLANYYGANVIYTLPHKDAVRDFVVPKVNPIIEMNPAIQQMIQTTDSIELKKVGERFVYFRGSWNQAAAISISAHALIKDERDRSNPKTLRTYQTRLDDAKRERPDLGFDWEFSNPSMEGQGVDERWQESDQKHWMVTCPHCGWEWYLIYPDNIDFHREEYICTKCHGILDREARRMGRWVAKYPHRPISGYWISQLIVPWIPASKIIRDAKGDQSIFYNFTLGLPYTAKDYGVDRKTIINCLIPDQNPMTNVAMGVDNSARLKHYVIGNRFGIFRVGSTESWEEIEDMRNRYGAFMVIDANPYPVQPKRLVEKYRGKVFIHYYVEDKKQVGIIRWGEGDKRGVVESDRTKVLDLVVSELHSQDQVFNLTLYDLDEYIQHWGNLYRVVEEKLDAQGRSTGIRKPVWKHQEGKPDHLAHATVYYRIALEKTMSVGGIVKPSPKKELEHPVVSADQRVPSVDLKEVLQRVNRTKKDWRTK